MLLLPMRLIDIHPLTFNKCKQNTIALFLKTYGPGGGTLTIGIRDFTRIPVRIRTSEGDLTTGRSHLCRRIPKPNPDLGLSQCIRVLEDVEYRHFGWSGEVP